MIESSVHLLETSGYTSSNQRSEMTDCGTVSVSGAVLDSMLTRVAVMACTTMLVRIRKSYLLLLI